MRTLAIWMLCSSCFAGTWFVRPGVWTNQNLTTGNPIPQAGIYGTQDGTSYADAWNGLTSIVWGGGGVNPSDTLYVCGTHIYWVSNFINDFRAQAITTVSVSSVTIRMDWPIDRGTVFGGAISPVSFSSDIQGPDVNGVYWWKLHSAGSPLPQVFEVHGATITRLKQQSNVTWVGQLGSQYMLSQTNYVKLGDGSAPTTNVMAMAENGWTFDFNTQSNITFESCNFISDQMAFFAWGGIINRRPNYGVGPYANHITFTNCTFNNGETITLYPGQDNWSFLNCEIANHPTAIYSLIDLQLFAANVLTVSNCWIHDTKTPEYPDIDGHAVGIQGGNYHVVTHNVTSNTGTAIAFFTGNVPMRTNTISYNYVRTARTASGDGISVSGDNNLALPGYRNGFKVYGNIVRSVARGISTSSQDYIEFFNNDIQDCGTGIWMSNAQGPAPNALVKNNIILSCSTNSIRSAGNGPTATNLVINYDCYYPANNIFVFPASAHDAQSKVANPLFISATPQAATDFQLQGVSPARGAGSAVAGYTVDYIGQPVQNPPSMGAFEFVGPIGAPHLLKVSNLNIGTLIMQ